MDETYKHWTGRAVFTAGVRWVAESAGAYWLIDAILSHGHNPRVRAEEFQHWTLTVDLTKRSAVLDMTDGNDGEPIVRQVIEYTDFPEETADFYLVSTPGQVPVLMLPCEY